MDIPTSPHRSFRSFPSLAGIDQWVIRRGSHLKYSGLIEADDALEFPEENGDLDAQTGGNFVEGTDRCAGLGTLDLAQETGR